MPHVLILGYGSFGRALLHTFMRGEKAALPVSVFLRAPNVQHQELGKCDSVYYRPADIPLARFTHVVVALPSYAVREVLSAIADANVCTPIYVSCCKGIDFATGQFPSEIIAEACSAAPMAILSGPSFADELVAGKKACVTVASAHPKIAENVREHFASETLGIQLTSDVRGLEILGVAKNLIALGSGLIDGQELSENFRAAFISAGIRELARLLPLLGGQPDTVHCYGGVGDILLTSVSEKSRNYRMGRILGRKLPQEALMSEGLYSATSFVRYLSRVGLRSSYFETISASLACPELIAKALDVREVSRCE